jgi:ubiquinone/menaquinone biosynthesis C-methylase UbiE
MDDGKVLKIKKAVQSNFNESSSHYDDFEDKHKFFRLLNDRLISGMNFGAGADILDIGCGTGASCLQILKRVPMSNVWGLDNSAAMLARAQSKFADHPRISFVEGDASCLRKYFNFKFDAIIYSASIFLIPDYRVSLEQAAALLKENGTIGLSFMDGVYDAAGDNLLEMAAKAANEKISLKKPVKFDEFSNAFAEIFPRRRTWIDNLELPVHVIKDFFSVPAMSAGLFPGIDYQSRLEKLEKCFSRVRLPEALFRWILMVGEKR